MAQKDPVIQQVLNEQHQGHPTRKGIFVKLETVLKRPTVSFFTSFIYPVMIEDSDADILEGILQEIDLSNGLALVISSPGGDGLAAERIINICRSYSETGEYWAIVPGKAKSAATMVCFGASKILMGATSELGPIDPQLTVSEDGVVNRFSVYNIVKSYEELFAEAMDAEGNLEPYLQQLANYDAREIAELKAVLELSEDIAIRALASGMMEGKPDEEIEKKIETFLIPTKRVKTHGRAIHWKEASECGLTIEKVEAKSQLWKLLYELYIRTNNFVSTEVSKCVESRDYSFIVKSKEGY